MFKKLLTTKPELAPLVLRLTMAMVIWPHGAQLLLGWFGGYGYIKSIDYFASQGLSNSIGFLVIFLEFFGALFILVGLGTRFFAFAIIGLFSGMILTIHLPVGFFMNWYGTQKGEGYEYHLLMIGMAVALLISGGGTWSFDGKLTTSSPVNS